MPNPEIIYHLKRVNDALNCDICNKSRVETYRNPRHTFMLVMHERFYSNHTQNKGYSELGRIFNVKHPSVKNAVEKVEFLVKIKDRKFVDLYNIIKGIVYV